MRQVELGTIQATTPRDAARDRDNRTHRSAPIRISLASAEERETIYHLRHAVYAEELGQHARRPDGRLVDSLDAFNHYIVATVDGNLVGFVSITPPGFGTYSIDKYISRDDLPFPVDEGLFEIRILTVDPAHRGSPVAAILMYASLRWVEEHGARNIVIIGRTEVAGLYERVGMRRLGRTVHSGAVSFELMAASVADLRAGIPAFTRQLRRIVTRLDWALTIPFQTRPGAFHGGASQDALGLTPSNERRSSVITADVLDAWFPPAPGVRHQLSRDVDFLASASPPTDSIELRGAIGNSLDVDPLAILPGAGLSDLIFRCLPRWVMPTDRVLLAEPQYGEYRHVLETLVRCRVDRLVLDPGIDEVATLPESVAAGRYDLVVLVDPNNPLGYRFDPAALANSIRGLPTTRFWIDRTYAPFEGHDRSLERFAAGSRNVIVGMSMSKAYALSGLRVGYVCGPPDLLADAWRATPPWIISRPAGAAAVAALADPAYYAERYRETRLLREELRQGLDRIPGIRTRGSVANFVLSDLDRPLDAATVVERAAARGLYVRAFPSEPGLRWRAIRIAVRDGPTQKRILEILDGVVDETASARRQASLA